MDTLIKFTNLERVLTEFAEELKAQYQYNLAQNNRFATRNLMSSVDYIVKYGNNSYVVSLKLQDYWKYVENGRPPTQNNGDGSLRRAILSWIKAKPVLPTPINGKLPTPEQLAYLISRKIHREGTQGTHDLRNATEDIYGNFQERIYQALEKDIDETLIKIFLY